MIGRALSRTEHNKGAAARLLGLKRTTLVEKLKRF
jgi:transcriptional regulator with PAS, ATPase and Fis domain